MFIDFVAMSEEKRKSLLVEVLNKDGECTTNEHNVTNISRHE